MMGDRCNFLMVRRDGTEENVLGLLSNVSSIYDFVAKQSGVPRHALVVANMLKLDGQVMLLHTVEDTMTFAQLKPPPNVPHDLLQLYAYEVDHPPALLRHRRGFGLHDRCERLYQGEWFAGQIVKVSRVNGLGLEYRYTFQYDNDGLVSKHTPASKLRWPGEIEPRSAIVVTFPQDKENRGLPQQSSRLGTMRLSTIPRFFTIKTATSEGRTYEMVADKLSVDPDDFLLTVVDREGHPLCRAPLDATNFSPIVCKERLLLALQWTNGDPRARAPTPPRAPPRGAPVPSQRLEDRGTPGDTPGDSDIWSAPRVNDTVSSDIFKEADDIELDFDDVDTNGNGHINEEEYNDAMATVQGALQALELSEPAWDEDCDISMEVTEEDIQQLADAGTLETLAEEAEATEGDFTVWKQEEEARTERLKAVARAEQEETDKQKVCFGILRRLQELQELRTELDAGNIASLAAELVELGTELQQLKDSPVVLEPEEAENTNTSAFKTIGLKKKKDKVKVSDEVPPWPGARDVFSLDAAFDRSNHCVVQSVTEGEEDDVEEDCVQERNAAAAAGKHAAEELLKTLEPSEQELVSRRARLNDLADEALRLHSAIAKLDSEAPSATENSWYMKLHENGLLKLHTQLPVLATVSGSPSVVFSSAWGQYQRAREGELLAERALLAESSVNGLDGGRVKALEVAVETRVQATVGLHSAFVALEKECAEVKANLLIAARNNAKWCVDEVLDQRNALELTGNRIESTAQRARAFLGRLERFFEAQVQKESTQDKFDRLLDRQDELEEVLLLAQSALSKAERRGRSVDGPREKVIRAEEQLASFLRSEEYNAVTSATHTLLEQLPELTPAFATMDPFRGTSAQGIRVRQMGAFTEVQPLTTHHQRHEMLKARFVDDKGEERWCVLKGFDACDEKQLRRELGALNRLQHHRNIVDLLGVARQQQPLRWYLQLPLHPMNLRQWMVQSSRETETKEQRDLRVAPMLRGVLEGINFLHQMGEVHRDIKPENVLVSFDGEPKISDFETCKNVTPVPGTMTLTVSKVVGTGAYIAPEVLKSGHCAGSDMLSFGVMLGEALLDGLQLESATALSGLRLIPSDILDDEQRKILMSLLDPDPTRRPTAAQLLLEPFFRGRPQTRECGVCFGDYLLSEGIECDGEGHGDEAGASEAHFCCRDCFTRHVAVLAGENLRQLRRREAKVYCPKWPLECKAPPFSDVQVACVVSVESFEAYVGSRTKLTEQQLASEMEKQKQQELQRELKRLLDMDENQRRVASAAGRLREMLTDKCPRCAAAWTDFAGCCALSCHRCGAGFCAWCLKDCGSDAHRHVVLCPENVAPGRDLYASEKLWKQSRLIRRRRIVTEYLCGLDSRGIAEATVLVVQNDLTALGLSDIVTRFRQA